jgi:AraC family transcriptional regulator of adaptative response/methylated-DNA-[protein]-cysteine methyltransferase
MLIAATDKGVCALRFGEDEDMLAELRGEFPNASLSPDSQGLCGFAERVREHLATGHPDLDLPLDLNPTAFQRRVWKALRDIPYGETRAYRQVAEAIGDPGASRAVARACATNPVALVVPCHRVNGANGDLRGYRWGIDRKRWLLDKEGPARHK